MRKIIILIVLLIQLVLKATGQEVQPVLPTITDSIQVNKKVTKEYANRSLWVGLSGYAVAGLTGAMRIINNCHYLSDVIAGAGIGILSVELGYLTLPFWRRVLPINPKKSFALAPTMTSQSAGLYFSYTF